ncbi:MAG: thiamine phosphate synthase [Muribaculaceae bacterium]|nr:thiamine phosphate synthase [Muribaculaceae bacterium]
MRHGLLIIAITPPFHYPDEAERIMELLDSGEADFVHIRKPQWGASEISELLEGIPVSYHERIKLHDHFELIESSHIGGVHLNSRNPIPPTSAKSVSCSFHSIEQLASATHYDYVTLSPIFDSISKHGYKSAFSLEELKDKVKGKNVVALGGVTPEKLPEIAAAGFFGAAMLGHFWPSGNGINYE